MVELRQLLQRVRILVSLLIGPQSLRHHLGVLDNLSEALHAKVLVPSEALVRREFWDAHDDLEHGLDEIWEHLHEVVVVVFEDLGNADLEEIAPLDD